eukprot:TCALIF_10653-PA protein Name:"Protein of unknown function" AED:0.22 eAED:0.33 QI:20/0/0/1/0/0/2/0/92
MVTDFSALNIFVKRPVHSFPSPSEIVSSIPPDSKTPHLAPALDIAGLNASGDEYFLRGDQALENLKGIRKIIDDILIFAPNIEVLSQHVKDV